MSSPPPSCKAPRGVAAIDRACSVLQALGTSGGAMTLTALAEHTRLYRSTVLRLLASLQHARLVQRQADGRYTLGPGVALLHGAYLATFSLETLVMPVLQALSARTRESAALHVRQGGQRLCLHRVDSPQPVRDHIAVGDLLPLERGAGGRVLLAYEGEPGPPYERIRREGVAVMAGDREADLAGIAAPVFGPRSALVGALTLTMPASRLDPAHVGPVRQAAQALTAGLGGVPATT